MRVADQDASFLRFVESHNLKPGQQLAVDARDEVADSVSVHATGGKPLTIGARAASKLLVEVIAILVFVMGLAATVQRAVSLDLRPPRRRPRPPVRAVHSRSQDNSFFVEEAFNQEPGVVQTIYGGVFLQDSGWGITFTQEWPAPNMRHQLSFTIPFSGVDGAGRHRRHRAELSLPAPRGRTGTPRDRASPLAAACRAAINRAVWGSAAWACR